MTIQECALNEKQFGTKLSAEWNNEKIAGSINHALTILLISNRQQNMADFELLLEKYQNKSLGKSLFIESIMDLQMHSKRLKKCNANLF